MAENRPPGGKNHFQKIPGPRSARRNLFGRDPDTRESLARDVAELKKDSERRFKERWNYDLVADRPVVGSLDWGRGIPLNSQTSLLHVPSEGEIPSSVSAARGDDISSAAYISQPATTLSREDEESISILSSNGYEQPPNKKQRSSGMFALLF